MVNGARNTPAYAGKTDDNSYHVIDTQKHPRVCGEDLNGLIQTPQWSETPPRMRGRPSSDTSAVSMSRNTPAYAGKTQNSASVPAVCRKHPRVCGEDSSLSYRQTSPRETPPRMRGRPGKGRARCFTTRNTPAYAGKTSRHLAQASCRWKHPRVCGEDYHQIVMRQKRGETPPRMRGRPTKLDVTAAVRGNTPAYAGKT